MNQGFNHTFQLQTFNNQRFDQSINMQQSSVREQSIHNVTFRSNSKQLCESALKFLSGYKQIDSSFPIDTLKKRSNLTHKPYKQSHYYGEIANNKKHGLGIMVYSNQKVYEGEWQNDKKHGFGAQKFANNCHYQGKYQNGKPQGKGTYIWNNGQIYEGQWRKGERHGTGKWKGANGDSYDGEWRQGKPNGYGILTSANGDTYEGQFKDSLKNGTGIQKFVNGDMYRGEYVNGVPSGQGSYYWADKSFFKGCFLNGLREGQGIWKKGAGNCDRYEGCYKNDKKWGYGEFTWESGNHYKGSYEGDVRSGYGEMHWTNGSYYKGQWVNGVQHGQGQIFIPGVGYKKAIFSNNVITEVLNEQPINNTQQYNSRQQSMANSKSSKEKINTKSFRSKNTKNNVIRYKNPNIFQSNRQTLTQEVQQPKIQNYSLRLQIPMEKYKKRKLTFNKKKSGSKQDKQSAKDYRFQSLDIFRNKQKGKNETTEKSKSKQKNRILHSSFYLYKLNSRLEHTVPDRNKSSNYKAILQF